MNLCSHQLGAAVLTVGWLLQTGNSQATNGPCLLQVDGQTYLKGTCKISIEKGGSFSIQASNDRNNKHRAGVKREGPSSAKGVWNGVGGTNKFEQLGELTRRGACWTNDRATICAWRKGIKKHRILNGAKPAVIRHRVKKTRGQRIDQVIAFVLCFRSGSGRLAAAVKAKPGKRITLRSAGNR